MTETQAPPRSLLVSEVAELIQAKTGRRPSPDAVRRWAKSGVRVGGRVVKLPSTRVGTLTTIRPDDVQQFLDQLQAG